MPANLTARAVQRDDTHINRYLFIFGLETHMAGGQPADPEVLRGWLLSSRKSTIRKHARKQGLSEEDAEAALIQDGQLLPRAELDSIIASQEARLPEEESKAKGAEETRADASLSVFFRDEIGPYIMDYQVKAAIRECLTNLGITKAQRGSKQTYQHALKVVACTDDGVARDPAARIHFYDTAADAYLKEPSRVVERTGSVQTPQGPRSIIKRQEVVDPAIHPDVVLSFLVEVPARQRKSRRTAMLTDDNMAEVAHAMQANGLGAGRSQGFGQLRLLYLERLTDNPLIEE